jgi:orotate phosphoribosyltransferase
MSAEGQVLIGRMGLAAIAAAGWRPRAIGGLTMGADPVAYAIAAASWGTELVVDAFSVRKEAKSHGTGQLIEGNFKPGDPVVVVEDTITSGGSAMQAIAAVEGAGGHVVGVLAIVDREEGGGRALREAGRQVVALTTTSALGLAPAPSPVDSP